MMKRLVILLTGCILFSAAIAADLSKIKFEYLTVDNGLSQGTVEEIFQDSQGYMWFGTHDGLNRYNGLEFTVFLHDQNDPQSLVSNWVTCIAEDKAGRIWIGTDGLNRFDPVSGKMRRIPVDLKDPKAYHGGRVYDIDVDYDSTLWLSTGNGLVHYFPKDNTYKTYTAHGGANFSLGNNLVLNACITRNRRIFVAVDADALYEYDRRKDNFIEINYKLAYQGNNKGKNLYEGLDGLLYITSEFGALHILNPKTLESKLIDKEQGLNASSIRAKVIQMSPTEVWIGTDGGGINIFNPVSGTMQYVMSDSRNSNSLGSNAVIRMYMDRDKNVWVGHFGSGISVWKRNKEKFESFTNNPFEPSSINKEVVSALFQDSHGRIWIGQDGGGLSLFNQSTKQFEHFRHKNGDAGSLVNDVILAINEDPDGNLLLGTYGGGLMVFNPENSRVIKTYNSQNGLITDHVWSIYKDSKERYWVSNYISGYCLYNPEKGTFENFTMGTEGIMSTSQLVLNFTEDPKGKIWIATEDKGIMVVDYDNQNKKIYTYDEKNKNSLSNYNVRSIVFIGRYAWIATLGGGLNRLDLKTDSFKIYTVKNGLSSDALTGLLKDKENNLWISSTKGLMKFNTENGQVITFDKSQGIQGNEFKTNSQLKLDDGRMMFGGTNGLNLFHPDSVKRSPIVPQVVFTDFKVNNQSVVPGVKGSPLEFHINFTKQIRLSHKQSVFTIEFASLDYNAPLKNQYMYKLEGFDEDWVMAGNRHSITYTNLDPGKYTFLVKGSNSDGVWNETPRKIIIRVRPAWYATKLTMSLVILLIITLVYLYIKDREAVSKRDKAALEEKIKETENELKLKVNRLEEQQNEIKRRDEAERDYRFQTDGFALLSDIIAKKRRNIVELCTAITSELVRYIDASAGGIFVVDDDDQDNIMLRATGEFCMSSDQERIFSFMAGEGNIGICYTEKQTLCIDNLPDGYIVMRSGLGKVSLHHAVYVPILQDDKCVGVIEAASLEKLSPRNIGFIEKIAESLGSVITIIKASERTNRMLEENSIQAEVLKATEEEMKHNLDELYAKQEESQRKEEQLATELESRDKLIKELKAELEKKKKK